MDESKIKEEENVQMAVRLLQSVSIREVPTDQKLSYLRGKGVTDAQIAIAWDRMMDTAIKRDQQKRRCRAPRHMSDADSWDASLFNSEDPSVIDEENPLPPESDKPEERPKSSENDAKPPAPPVQMVIPFSATKAPKETLKAVYKAGIYKAGLPLNILAVQCFMAGIYIAMAGHLYLVVGGGVLGAALFPTGLIAVVLTSAELFTGDALIFVASVLGGQVSIKYLVRNWVVAWTFNFIGSLVWVALMAYASDAIADSGAADFAVKVALKKADQQWISIFLKAVGANFMVCVAVWQATCAEEAAGKILALWFPISAFVLMGFEHVIANQFLIPIGMIYGADISVGYFFYGALLPATLGNIVGGGLLVGAVYWYVFDSMAASNQLLYRVTTKFFNGRSRRKVNI